MPQVVETAIKSAESDLTEFHLECIKTELTVHRDSDLLIKIYDHQGAGQFLDAVFNFRTKLRIISVLHQTQIIVRLMPSEQWSRLSNHQIENQSGQFH